MKQYDMKQWAADRYFKAQICQPVSEEVVEHLRECVPPATNTVNCLQVGEAYDHTADMKPLFRTFERINGQWVYVGIKLKKTITTNK